MSRKILWNLKAKLYQKFRSIFPFGYILRQENESLLSLIKVTPANIQTALDLGTGEGNVLKLITSPVKKIGIDSNFNMLVNARRNIKAEFINGDVVFLSLKNKIADLVLIIGVLEYFPELEPVFNEIYRITTKNAHVIISYSPNNVWTFLRQFSGHRIFPNKLKKMKKIVQKSGFQFVTHKRLIMQHQILIKKVE
jgi:ubiquinone/menaquinone biosynthesis C-methylase UbiE